LLEGLSAAGLPPTCIQLVPTTDRAAVGHMLSDMADNIDVIVPRGGKSLISRVQKDARVPVIGHLEGVCHVHIDRGANLEMAKRIVLNAKMRRTGVCGSAETLLIDRACAPTHLAPLVRTLLDAGCEVRGDEAAAQVDLRVKPATEQDWYSEYLDAIIAVRVVDDISAAIATSRSTVRSTPSASSPMTRPRLSNFSTKSIAPSSCTMRPRSLPTAPSSAWVPRSASVRTNFTHAGPSAWSN